MAKQRKAAQEPPKYEPSYTIDEFCRVECISVEYYYKLKKLGRTPREMRLGGLIRITHRARLDWQRARENPTGEEKKEVERQDERLRERARRAGFKSGAEA